MVIDNYEKHSSYGMLTFNRASCSGPETLFGSSIGHRSIITIEISTAHIARSLSKDWIHPDKVILQAEMSPTQFADAITSLNAGAGTPITIKYCRQGPVEKAEPCPSISKIEQFNQEFADKVEDIASVMDEVIAEADELRVRKSLRDKLGLIKQQIAANMPFVNEQFTRQMEHTIKEAKGEVEAFVTGMIQKHGIEAIREQAPQLETPEDQKLLDNEKGREI